MIEVFAAIGIITIVGLSIVGLIALLDGTL